MNIDKNIIDLLKNQKKVTLGFSTGKDSLSCALILKELEINFIPFFFYHIPELEFIENNLKMYEDLLEIKIIRLPHPMLYDYVRHQDFQPPLMIDFMNEFNFSKMTFEKFMDLYFQDEFNEENIYYDVVGMRASESFNRRMFFKKNGALNEKKRKIYPIYNWKNEDVLNFLKSKNIPLTKDYNIWRRSFDGLKYQFLFGVKNNYPKDWEKIKEYFPLIELELFRYDANKEHLG